MRVAFVAILAVIFFSCKKKGFITSPDALLQTSIDTLHFDTVFTTTGSTTRFFKIINVNDQKLKLSNVQLMGGASSPFKLNVDGTPGINFNDIEIDRNDSIYAFVTVFINPTSANLPFIVRDSIKITYNGNTKFVQLDAFGQNANFLRNRRITSDTTWNNNLPFVILDGLTVNAGRMLTISKGTKIYVHADAPIIVNGTIKAIGEKYDSTRIVFQGDRLDEPYKTYPGSWPGILFTSQSHNNELQFVTVKNAYQGVITQPLSVAAPPGPKLTLNECIFDNIYDVAVGAVSSSISAINCQITNAGYNVFLSGGGNYNFTHCTIVSYSSFILQHKNPVLTLSNMNGTVSSALNATFRNCIIYGEGGNVDDEIVTNKQGTAAFNVTFDHVLYKVKATDPLNTTFTGTNLKNQKPIFDSINFLKPLFNFRLRSGPGVDAGVAVPGILFDLDGNNRSVGTKPDLGAYEKQ